MPGFRNVQALSRLLPLMDEPLVAELQVLENVSPSTFVRIAVSERNGYGAHDQVIVCVLGRNALFPVPSMKLLLQRECHRCYEFAVFACILCGLDQGIDL